MYSTYKSILKRIDILGVSEPEITIEGEDKIRIRLAGITNKEEAREVIANIDEKNTASLRVAEKCGVICNRLRR